MGLDAVTIVMDIEQRFGIQFKTDEAQQIRTVSDLVELVTQRVDAAQNAEHCYLLPAFRSVRRLARCAAQNSKLAVRPRDKVMDVLSRRERRVFWRGLEELLGGSPDSLGRPLWVNALTMVLALVWVFIAVSLAIVTSWEIFPLTFAMAIGLIVLVLLATGPLRTIPPPEWGTFGEIAIRVVGTTAATKPVADMSRDDIFNETRILLVDVLGVDVDEVVPEARLIDDLGME